MRALITGVSGQDGYYTARKLLAAGHEVHGLTSNAAKIPAIAEELGQTGLSVAAFDYADPEAMIGVIEQTRPKMVFNFAAKSTGQGMFDAPLEMARLNGGLVLDILEALRITGVDAHFVQASSAEMYGDAKETPQTETTPFQPKSPYGVAKVYAHNLVGVYRRAFDLRCSSAILFNHESVRRSTAFVTRKIAHAAAQIACGTAQQFHLGSVQARRDWGYAPEYAEAMIAMALQDIPEDFVIATGRLTSVARACEICFEHVGLDYRQHLVMDAALQRNIRTLDMCGDARAIEQKLGWTARTPIEDVLIEMVDHELLAISQIGRCPERG